MLAPLAALYSAAVNLRFKLKTPKKLSVPVICVGNLVMGGAGKTPTTLALATYLKDKGYQPHILSRGYGGNVNSPTLVNPLTHDASHVGDEPLLLAKAAPTWVCKDRLASGKMAIAAGADILILDDGFQNPTLFKDLSLVVVDSKQGFGNNHVFPAGPLRETMKQGMLRAHAVVLIGSDQLNLPMQHPTLKASIKPINADPKKVLAFTGLGFPDKFYETLKGLGYNIIQTKSFPDHHPYVLEEIERLIQHAKGLGARLITTEKDALRIPLEFHHHLDVLKIELKFEDLGKLQQILGNADL